MSYYAADGSMNVTVVDGSVYTGLYASDGSINVIKSTGGYVGAYHPCGAYWVSLTPGGIVPLRAPDGSLYVDDTGLSFNKNTGQRVTVVSGTLHPGGGTLGSPMGLLLALTYAS